MTERLQEVDRLAASIATRQWTDWRGLRFEPFDSVQVCNALVRLGNQICIALDRIKATLPTRPVSLVTSSQTHPRVFISYAHEDEALAERLRVHLKILERTGSVDVLDGRRIRAGTDWAGQIDQHLDEAQIILLLVSPAFLASDYCYDVEVARALERHQAGEALVIPVILRPCDWGGSPFAKLHALPPNARPISKWRNRDEALSSVADGIERAAKQFTRRDAT